MRAGNSLVKGTLPLQGRAAERFESVVAGEAVDKAEEAFGSVPLMVKRIMDLVIAATLLVALSPLLALVALLVRVGSPGPALFVQKRIGHGGRVFRMFKFRTMVVGAEDSEKRLAEERPDQMFLKIPDDSRVTRLGQFLRRYSIDELPQLFNLLLGDMSLVGPRPILICDFLNFREQEQIKRFAMLPGITGLWQISGRSNTTEEERIKLDLEYVDRWSLWLDVTILARTLPAVIRAEGAV